MSTSKRAFYDERKRSHDEEETPFSNRDYSNTQSARYSKRPALTTDEYDDGRFNNVRALAFRCLVTHTRGWHHYREAGSEHLVLKRTAFGLLAEHILKESDLSDLAGSPLDRLVNFRLLVPHGRMGSIIGKGGLKIKEIQDRTGAKLHASEEILPQSTERTLTITAVREVGLALKELPERTSSVIHFKPTASRGNIHNSPAPMFGGRLRVFLCGLGHGAYTYGYPGRAEFSLGGNAGGGYRNERYASRRLRSFKRDGRSTVVSTQAQQTHIPQRDVAESVNGSSERLVTITGTPMLTESPFISFIPALKPKNPKFLRASGHGHR
ncbi:PAB1 binding protein [Massospora cicadina]|nr:PAB1 binding protein [Massospora cicadina]